MCIKTYVLNGWAASERAWDLCRFRRDRVFSYVEQLDGRPAGALGAEQDGAVLVGWSMGGSRALQLAIEFPEKVKWLVLVASTPRMMRAPGWPGMSERRLQALEAGLRMTHGEGFFGSPEGRPNPYMMDDDANLERGLAYLRDTDLRAGLAALKSSGQLDCPVFVFQSERDGIVRRENAAYLASVLPGAVVEMVEGAEHALPVSIPERIDAAVERCNAVLRLV